MSIIRWEPFSELMSLRQAMDRLMEDSFVRPSTLFREMLGGEYFPVDMYQTDNDVVVKASLPGVSPENVEISITGDTLTIKGEIKQEQETKREHYFRQERRYGSFSRSLTIPTMVQTDKAEAVFEHGVLTLTIPKAEEIKPKTIKVKAKGTLEGKKP